MKKLILNKATDLFLNFGFKSVTMDQIANEIGISKKTIYNFFENKKHLVNVVTNGMFASITSGIKQIKKESLDPISELFDIKLFLIKILKGERTTPLYQLRKFYPETHKEITQKQFDFMTKSAIESLKNGVKLGLFRKDINIDLISRLYFNGMIGIKDQDIFPAEKYEPTFLMLKYIEYHLRAIVTEKGLKKLNSFLKKY
ncbi:MAG: TetR family transcriptional regulator [Flavobacteriaceae bacterium]|nr:TetR family transcriptional regulator [Flavobacteriaceae bacterium]|tara:strand:+ start:1738 stop:2337 length:600 start_codon:yes stop_codon:yes gene_type:complete